jgi:hypothetical protein
MKKHIVLVVGAFLCVFLLAGCLKIKSGSKSDAGKSTTNPIVTSDRAISNNTSNTNIDPFASVTAADVEWITQKGGLPSTKK